MPVLYGAVAPAITLLPSAARTANGNGSDISDVQIENASRLMFVLDVTAIAGTPTLDVAICAKIGSKYYNLVNFARISGTGTRLMKAQELVDATNGVQDLIDLASISVGSSATSNEKFEWHDTLCVKYAIGGTTPSFTFSVVVYPIL